MINDPRGLVNDQIKEQVLKGLKSFVTNKDELFTNGDIKDRAQLAFKNVQINKRLNFYLKKSLSSVDSLTIY